MVWVLIGVVVLAGVYVGAAYNGLVSANEGVDAQWAQVESQYQRRFDLVPNLVASVQGVMKQEQKVFADIADARTKYTGAQTIDDKAAAASQFEGSLGRLLVVMEAYPQLRSVETVTALMAELAGTENRISVERMRYNEMVRDYNISVKTFPKSLAASLFGFHARTMFEAAAGADTVPKVQL